MIGLEGIVPAAAGVLERIGLRGLCLLRLMCLRGLCLLQMIGLEGIVPAAADVLERIVPAASVPWVERIEPAAAVEAGEGCACCAAAAVAWKELILGAHGLAFAPLTCCFSCFACGAQRCEVDVPDMSTDSQLLAARPKLSFCQTFQATVEEWSIQLTSTAHQLSVFQPFFHVRLLGFQPHVN
eukprot:1160098-Pelagomonas_calceolata.AAC.9